MISSALGVRHTQFHALSYAEGMDRRWRYSHPNTVLQERAEYTVELVDEALRAALVAGESNFELQLRQLAGEAGEYGQALMIAAVDRTLRSCQWPLMHPRTPRSTIRHLLGMAEDGELQIRMCLYEPGVITLYLQRQVHWEPVEYLRDLRIPMDSGLWEQILEAR